MSPIESFLQRTPKAVLVGGALVLGLGFAVYTNPPHSICDTQIENIQKDLTFSIFPGKTTKSSVPPSIQAHKSACQFGNSAGACFEYFNLLKKVTTVINQSNRECLPQIFEIPEIDSALINGLDIMSRLAWGEKPPAAGTNEKLGWFQEAEVSVFCKVYRLMVRAKDEQSIQQLRRNIFSHLPGRDMGEVLAKEAEARKSGAIPDGNGEDVKLNTGEGTAHALFVPATQSMPESDIFSRSLFSIRCDEY